MKKLVVLAALLPALAGTPAARAAAVPPVARASVLEVQLAPTREPVSLATSFARGGSAPVSTASAMEVPGIDAPSVVADESRPDAVATLQDYIDPTDSMTMQAGFAEAHVSGTGSNARAGFGEGSGSGFALANEFFTFEQQAEMLAQWKQVNDQLAGALNTALEPLDTALGVAGLSIPPVNGIPPTGLIDVMSGRLIASSSSASLSPGFSSGRAEATAAELVLFDGFIRIENVTARAVAESVQGADTRTATATYGRLSIAGLDVIADDERFVVAGNGIDGSLLQPLLDAALAALRSTGVEITVGQVVAARSTRSVSALSISIPAAGMRITVGNASAGAPTVAAVGGSRTTRTVTPAAEPPADASVPVVPPPGSVIAAPLTTTVIGPVDRSLGRRAARVLALVFLLITVGGLVATAAPLPLIRRARARRLDMQGEPS